LPPSVKLAAGGVRRRVRKQANYILEDSCCVQRVSCQGRFGRSWAAVRDSIATPEQTNYRRIRRACRRLHQSRAGIKELAAIRFGRTERSSPSVAPDRVAPEGSSLSSTRGLVAAQEGSSLSSTRGLVAAQEGSLLSSTRGGLIAGGRAAQIARRRTRGLVAAPEVLSPHQ